MNLSEVISCIKRNHHTRKYGVILISDFLCLPMDMAEDIYDEYFPEEKE